MLALLALAEKLREAAVKKGGITPSRFFEIKEA
jgi:hypothetical protein